MTKLEEIKAYMAERVTNDNVLSIYGEDVDRLFDMLDQVIEDDAGMVEIPMYTGIMKP